MTTHTESEAKSKWCPMARTAYHDMTVNRISDDGGNPNHIAGVSYDTRCIASECMMWRWEPHPEGHELFGSCGLARP